MTPSSLVHPHLPDTFDVLIVGAGAAGLYTALCLPAHFRVGLLTKDTLSLSASDWAQGGIAAAIAPDDSPLLHVEDTLKAGAGLCDRDAVMLLADRAHECIHALVDMGVAFDRHGQQLAMTLEAAHSRRRVLHAADTTGHALITTLTAQVLSRKNIHVISNAFALDLWLHPESGHCQGVVAIWQQQMTQIQARSVILATGGGGQVFARTTNPALSTGDGVAMAWRTGALLRDLEFIQFHPTALTLAHAPRFLISEAVRGEGAHLVNSEGRRFTFDYDPAGELAPRDIVSRAIFDYLQRHEPPDPEGLSHVWLDLRPIPADTIRHRFPNIIQVCQQWGINVFQDPIPVAPAAHYWMGGVATDLISRASIPGLYAVGETASTGVHGANRLASNSLLECLVFGAQLAHLELLPNPPAIATDMPCFDTSLAIAPLETRADWTQQQTQIHHWRQKLPLTIWNSAGICRDQETLAAAIAQVEVWRDQFAQLPITGEIIGQMQQVMRSPPGESSSWSLWESDLQMRQWGELRNLFDIGLLILKSAAFRQESRGGHYRRDFPHSDANWQAHTLIQGDRTWVEPTHDPLA